MLDETETREEGSDTEQLGQSSSGEEDNGNYFLGKDNGFHARNLIKLVVIIYLQRMQVLQKKLNNLLMLGAVSFPMKSCI